MKSMLKVGRSTIVTRATSLDLIGPRRSYRQFIADQHFIEDHLATGNC